MFITQTSFKMYMYFFLGKTVRYVCLSLFVDKKQKNEKKFYQTWVLFNWDDFLYHVWNCVNKVINLQLAKLQSILIALLS